MEATHDDVRFAVDAPSGGIIDADLFPRPFTIYARNVEDVSLGVFNFALALTNSERRNQRRRDGARRGSGTEAELACQPWRDRTERRPETGSSSKDYASAKEDAVNKLACKSVEGKSLAPQVGLEPTTLRLTPIVNRGLRCANLFGPPGSEFRKNGPLG